jgi:hypothetical protein
MPSPAGYTRNYRQEKKTSDARGEKPKRAKRNKARRKLMKEGKVKVGDGKHVDHKKPLRSGGSNSKSNLRVRSASANASDNGHKKKKKKKK